MNTKHKIIATAGLLLLPSFVFAATYNNLTELIKGILGIVQQLVVLSVGLALLFFFWGIAKFLFNLGNQAKVEEGRKMMVYGIVALFVMTSVWGLVTFLKNSFFASSPNPGNLQTNQNPPPYTGGDPTQHF